MLLFIVSALAMETESHHQIAIEPQFYYDSWDCEEISIEHEPEQFYNDSFYIADSFAPSYRLLLELFFLAEFPDRGPNILHMSDNELTEALQQSLVDKLEQASLSPIKATEYLLPSAPDFEYNHALHIWLQVQHSLHHDRNSLVDWCIHVLPQLWSLAGVCTSLKSLFCLELSIASLFHFIRASNRYPEEEAGSLQTAVLSYDPLALTHMLHHLRSADQASSSAIHNPFDFLDDAEGAHDFLVIGVFAWVVYEFNELCHEIRIPEPVMTWLLGRLDAQYIKQTAHSVQAYIPAVATVLNLLSQVYRFRGMSRHWDTHMELALSVLQDQQKVSSLQTPIITLALLSALVAMILHRSSDDLSQKNRLLCFEFALSILNPDSTSVAASAAPSSNTSPSAVDDNLSLKVSITALRLLTVLNLTSHEHPSYEWLSFRATSAPSALSIILPYLVPKSLRWHHRMLHQAALSACCSLIADAPSVVRKSKLHLQSVIQAMEHFKRVGMVQILKIHLLISEVHSDWLSSNLEKVITSVLLALHFVGSGQSPTLLVPRQERLSGNQLENLLQSASSPVSTIFLPSFLAALQLLFPFPCPAEKQIYLLNDLFRDDLLWDGPDRLRIDSGPDVWYFTSVILTTSNLEVPLPSWEHARWLLCAVGLCCTFASQVIRNNRTQLLLPTLLDSAYDHLINCAENQSSDASSLQSNFRPDFADLRYPLAYGLNREAVSL